MRFTGYSYPWDVVDSPGFTDRAAELGVDEVAVALSYHSARAATPWSLGRTALHARYAALYRPVREDAWLGARLRPSAPDWLVWTDAGGEAVRMLAKAGVPAAGWVVLTHNSRLGIAYPELALQNCFGEPYQWALCPSSAEVREFAATLAAEAVRDLELSSVVLEACGQLGAMHQCHHEKTNAVWSPATARLLSVCCCAACAQRWTAAGANPAEVRSRLRNGVHRLIRDGDLSANGAPADPPADLPEQLASLLLACRQAGTDQLRADVVAACRRELGEGVRIVLHGSVDPWATGALPALTPAAARNVDGLDSVVLPCWQPGTATVSSVREARALLPSRVGVGAYVTAVGASSLPDPAGYVTELGRAGADRLHLYHLGLAGPARWGDMLATAAGARTMHPGGHHDKGHAL